MYDNIISYYVRPFFRPHYAYCPSVSLFLCPFTKTQFLAPNIANRLLTVVRPSLLSVLETLSNWMDDRIHVGTRRRHLLVRWQIPCGVKHVEILAPYRAYSKLSLTTSFNLLSVPLCSASRFQQFHENASTTIWILAFQRIDKLSNRGKSM